MIMINKFSGGNSIVIGNIGSGTTIINGREVRGNVRIVDGEVFINEGKDFSVDESKSFKCRNKLKIDAEMFNVTLSPSDDSLVTAHLYGDCATDGDAPTLFVEESKDEVCVNAEYSGTFMSGKLRLDVSVPKEYINRVNIKSSSGKVRVDEGLSIGGIKVKTMSGKVILGSCVEYITVNTMSGGIELDVTATDDFEADLKTMSGKIDIKLQNVSRLKLRTSTITGRVKDRFVESDEGFTADIGCSTMSGSIHTDN